MDLEYIKCSLCHADDTQLLFEGPDRLHGLPGIFTVVQCQQCGLVYLNPRPTKGGIGAYYPDDYEPHVFLKRIRSSRLARLDYQYGLGKRHKAIEKWAQSGRILDVGCGNGGFLYYMQEQGWEVYGEDVSQSATDYARKELGLNVFLGELCDAAFPSAHFDVVTLWNVLEHLHDPTATLAEIKRVLKPKGLLVIAVPNLASWDARLFGMTWVGYDVPRHLYTFTPETLETLLGQAGFLAVQRRCLFGSHQSIVGSLYFSLYRAGQPQLNRALVRQIAASRPLRLLASPLLRLMDTLGKGGLMTVFCQIHYDDLGRELL